VYKNYGVQDKLNIPPLITWWCAAPTVTMWHSTSNNEGFTRVINDVPRDEKHRDSAGSTCQHMANPLFQCRFQLAVVPSTAFWDNIAQHHAMGITAAHLLRQTASPVAVPSVWRLQLLLWMDFITCAMDWVDIGSYTSSVHPRGHHEASCGAIRTSPAAFDHIE